MKVGCGSPCWTGVFLPLYEGGKPSQISNYIAINLDSDLVAYIYDEDITVQSLRSSRKTKLYPAAYPAACIDSAYFRNNKLYYQWNGETFYGKGRKATATKKEYAIKK